MVLTNETYTYWECDRCKINSETKERMCPCPRGSCDAEEKGVIHITKTLYLNNPPRNGSDDNNLEQIIASINA